MSLTQQQLDLRRRGLTATDMTVLAGVTPYGRTVHDVYLSKLGLEEPFEATAAMNMGHRLEPVALAALAEERGLTLTPGTTEASPLIPWAIATPDANVLSAPGRIRVAVAEAKAVGLRMAARWGESGDPDGIPDEVRVQVQWQMTVTRTPRAHVVALLGTEARFFEIEGDEELAGALLELGEGFWKRHILAKAPPPLDGSEGAARMVRGLFRRARGGMVPAGPEAEERVRAYLAAKDALEQAERAKSQAQAQLCALIGEHEGIEGEAWTATWKERAGSPDWKALAEKLGATKALADEYRREGARVLNVRIKKEKAA
jgi:putative phage-type endonuclease